jgi:hypothetical protein
MGYRKKAGNFMQQFNQNQQQPNQYQQQQQQQPNQYQYQQQHQQQSKSMIGDAMNNMQPVYDATATIGIAYSVFSTVIATIVCSIAIFVGVWVKNLNKDKTAKAVGVITEANCTNSKKDKSCVATINFKANKVDYTVSSSTLGIVNKGQNINIYYDPKNPNNFTSNSYTNIIGWVIIIFAVIVLLISWGWLIMTIMFKPVAAASGVGAVADAVIPGNNSYDYY